MEWLIVALCALGGGVFRRGIGIGDNLPRFVPILFSVPFAVLAAWPYGDVWVTLVVAAYMILYFLPGHTYAGENWQSPFLLRYIGPVIVAFFAQAVLSEFEWYSDSEFRYMYDASLLFFAGSLTLFGVYYLANYLYDKGIEVPTNKYFDGPHSYAEFLGGAAVFGWVSVIWAL